MRCFDLEGVSRFGDRAAIYAAARPSYPAAAIEAILSGHASSLPVIDIGTGTGIGARLLAGRGIRVIGVDPGAEMLRAAAPHDYVRWIEGKAEQMPLPSGATDLITAFNAFHWFKPQPFFEEVRRVVRSAGRLALVWNDWDLRDEFTASFVRLMRNAAGDFPPEDRDAEVAPLYETPAVRNIRRYEFENVHRLDRQLLPLRLQSMSYIPRQGPRWESLSRELDALFGRYAAEGIVEHRYLTRVFLADVVSISPPAVRQ